MAEFFALKVYPSWICAVKYQYSNCTDPSRICILTPYQNAVLSAANASDPRTMLQIETWTGAQCRYSVNADATFSNGQPFLEDNGTYSIQHTIPLNYVGADGFVRPGNYSIYERCIDSTGNESSKIQQFIVTPSGLSAKILGIRGAEAATFLVSTNSTGAVANYNSKFHSFHGDINSSIRKSESCACS